MTGNLRSDVCKGFSECAISSVGMACVFLVLKSEFKPCFGSYFFQDQFLFFSKIFSCFFYLPIVFFNHSRVKIKI